MSKRDLRDLREAMGLSQETLAREVGVSLQTVWRWESGGMVPTARHLKALAWVLGVKVEDVAVGRNSA